MQAQRARDQRNMIVDGMIGGGTGRSTRGADNAALPPGDREIADHRHSEVADTEIADAAPNIRPQRNGTSAYTVNANNSIRGGFAVITEAMASMSEAYADISSSLHSFSERERRQQVVSTFMEICNQIDQLGDQIADCENAARRSVLNLRMDFLTTELETMREEQRQAN